VLPDFGSLHHSPSHPESAQDRIEFGTLNELETSEVFLIKAKSLDSHCRAILVNG